MLPSLAEEELHTCITGYVPIVLYTIHTYVYRCKCRYLHGRCSWPAICGVLICLIKREPRIYGCRKFSHVDINCLNVFTYFLTVYNVDGSAYDSFMISVSPVRKYASPGMQ